MRSEQTVTDVVDGAPPAKPFGPVEDDDGLDLVAVVGTAPAIQPKAPAERSRWVEGNVMYG